MLPHKNMADFVSLVMETCAYAGSGNVLNIQKLLHLCAEHKENEKESRLGFWITGFGVFVFWNIATLFGALGAKALGNPAAWGLDAAVPSAFLGLLWFRIKDIRSRYVAVSAFIVSLLLTPITGSGIPIISTSVLAVIFGWRENKKAVGNTKESADNE